MLYRDSGGRFRRAPIADRQPVQPPAPYDGPSWLGAALTVGAIFAVLAVVIWVFQQAPVVR